MRYFSFFLFWKILYPPLLQREVRRKVRSNKSLTDFFGLSPILSAFSSDQRFFFENRIAKRLDDLTVAGMNDNGLPILKRKNRDRTARSLERPE